MAESEKPVRWYHLRFSRVLIILFFFAALIVIDLVAVTTLGTNASQTFNTVKTSVSTPAATPAKKVPN